MNGLVRIGGLEHAGVRVRDTESTAKWYCSVFGAVEISRSPGVRPNIFLSLGRGSLIELVHASEVDIAASKDHVHLCLSVDDMSAAVAAFEGQGGHLERPVGTAPDGSPIVFLRDPEGNLLQFAQRVSGSGINAAAYGESTH